MNLSCLVIYEFEPSHHWCHVGVFWFCVSIVCYLTRAAILAYKTVSGTKSFKKLVHLTLQFLAFCLSLIGLWAAWKFHNDKGINNFYSLHSWLGLACLLLFGIQVFFIFPFHSLWWLPMCTMFHEAYELLIIFSSFQWAAGFVTFWYPGGSRNSRATLLPWHVFFGVYIYALAVATATTGILEKATFLQTNKVISHYSTEALLVNSLGILMIVLGGLVVLATITSLNSKGDIPRNATE